MIVIPSCVCSSLTPAAVEIHIAYGVPVSRVNMCSIIFSILYPPMSFLAIYMFKHLKITTVLRLGAINLFLAGWFRMLVVTEDAFWPVLVGYGWLSLTYPITLSGCTLIANKWFNDKERALVTSLLGLCIPIGSIVSFTMAGIIFAHPDTKKDLATLLLD
jgi:hypothetical protein